MHFGLLLQSEKKHAVFSAVEGGLTHMQGCFTLRTSVPNIDLKKKHGKDVVGGIGRALRIT